MTLNTPAAAPKPFHFSILIADDDTKNRETLADMLRDHGFQTIVAKDGGEAVEIVQVTMIHLVLIDMHMPKLTGLEAVEMVRQMNALLPAILMTADATRELIRRAHAAQVYSVLPKPVNVNIMLHTLTRALVNTYGPGPQPEENS
ncbi:MAG: response regulator [Gemmataceae bacterium]